MKDFLQGTAVCDMHGEYEWRYIHIERDKGDAAVVLQGERYVNMPDGMMYNKLDHKWRGRATCPKCGKSQIIEILDDTE